MQEYILITKPAEKENKSPNIITLFNGEILQAGLKKDIEPFEIYAQYLEYDLKAIEINGKHRFSTYHYFVNGGIRTRYYWKDRPLELMPLKPLTNIEGSMRFYARAVDILYRFENKIKELFPEAEYKLIVKHNACCLLQPRIKLKSGKIKQIKETFPEFTLEDKINETIYEPNILPPIIYEEDYSEHDGYYDCPRCDPDPCWARYNVEKPEQDLHDEFCERKVPKRNKGNPRAHCVGTRTKERPADPEYVSLGYWKIPSKELLSRIENPKKDDQLEELIEERRRRVLTRKIKISLTDKPIDFHELSDILVPDIEAYTKLLELEKRGLIKEYHPNNE